MRISGGLIILITIFWLSCDSQEYPSGSSVNGSWTSLGSGWVLNIIDSSKYTFYDITSISCLPSRSGDYADIQGALKLSNDTLSLKEGIITYRFIRTNGISDLCNQVLTKSNEEDPLYNFEVFSATVAENYAFLELNNINWNSLYEEQKSKITSATTAPELYVIIEETLEKLNDNHAFLEASDDIYEALDSMSVDDDSKGLLENQELPEYGDFQVAAMVAQHHLQEDMTDDSWLIHWGKMTEDIGFIQLKAMWLHADLEIPVKLINEIGYVDAYVETFHKMYAGDYIAKEIKGINNTMKQIFKDLNQMKSIVIDVRFNGGGQDAVSFEILRHFTSQKTQIAQQQLRYRDYKTDVLPLHIEGNADAYPNTVYILTSTQTGSAAETLALATMAMNNVHRIGSPTNGAMSTALEKTLPNGWAFSISNEIFMDTQGRNYENLGVPPDYTIEYSRDRQTFFRSIVDDLDKDKRSILEGIKKIEKQNHK